MGILFGIVAMISWGVADFIATKAVRETSIFKTFIWSQISGVILLFFIFLIFFKLPLISVENISFIVLNTVLSLFTYFAFYKGLQVGKVAVISPVTACWGVIAAILSVIFLHETLTLIQVFGISLAILGAVLTSFKWNDLVKLRVDKRATGLEYAIIAMCSSGVFMVFTALLVKSLGWFLPVFLIRSSMVFCLLLYGGIGKKNMAFPKKARWVIIFTGILEAVALAAYGVGIHSEYTAVVAPVSATFPVITVLLARIFLKETLETNQKIGIVAVLSGLVLLSL